MLEAKSLWQAVSGELELSLSRANFTTWFRHVTISLVDGNEVVISVPNIFTKEWLENKYHKQIQAAFYNILKENIKIQYRVGREPATNKGLIPKLTEEMPALVSLETAAPLAETTNLNQRYVFPSFVVGPSNKLAYAAAHSVATKPGENYNPFFIYGGVGLGKTHLMQAIGNEIKSNFPKKKVVYITSERFINEFITAIGTRKTNEFKDKYRKIDVLLVDDLQFLQGKEETQNEFFHTFNALHQENKQIVLTSDRPPKAIPSLEERLRSRFEWGMIADIQPPNLETRIAILQNKAQAKGYDIPLEIFDYIARHIQKNIRELEGALTRVIAYCELNSSPLDLGTATSVLENLIAAPRKKSVTSQQIIEKTASFYDVSISDILGKKRDRDIVVPRQIVMYLLREELQLSYPKIAAHIGKRDHTTAIHSCVKIEKELDASESLRHEINLIKERLYIN